MHPLTLGEGDWIFKYNVFINNLGDPIVGTSANHGLTA